MSKETMTPISLDGYTLARHRENRLKEVFDEFNRNFRRTYPSLSVPILTIASLLNEDDEASIRYTKMKLDAALRIGINFQEIHYHKSTSRNELAALIESFALDLNTQGLMLQLPVPKKLNILQDDLVRLIPPHKDVDGLLVNSPYVGATAGGVRTLLNEELDQKFSVNWRAKMITVIGSRGIVGTGLIKLFRSEGAQEISGIEIDTPQEERHRLLQQSGIVISTTGHEDEITQAEIDAIRPGFIWINVGLKKPPQALIDKSSFYTPHQKSVGPMTIQTLMENGFLAFGASLSPEVRALLPTFDQSR